jgi:hypothetical protein
VLRLSRAVQVFFGYSANNRLGAKPKQDLQPRRPLPSQPSPPKGGKTVGTATMNTFSRSMAGTMALSTKLQPEPVQAVVRFHLTRAQSRSTQAQVGRLRRYDEMRACVCGFCRSATS